MELSSRCCKQFSMQAVFLSTARNCLGSSAVRPTAPTMHRSSAARSNSSSPSLVPGAHARSSAKRTTAAPHLSPAAHSALNHAPRLEEIARQLAPPMRFLDGIVQLDEILCAREVGVCVCVCVCVFGRGCGCCCNRSCCGWCSQRRIVCARRHEGQCCSRVLGE
jgi:hypothetical protein